MKVTVFSNVFLFKYPRGGTDTIYPLPSFETETSQLPVKTLPVQASQRHAIVAVVC